jgi:phosphate:Na+ symporter
MVGFIQILGGLALFLYGIDMLSSGIEKLAGDQIQKWLEKVTNNRFKSAAFGAVATALVQSSSLIMVTMIGLINANLMSVEQAIGVMLGQEIGTTMTASLSLLTSAIIVWFWSSSGWRFLNSFPKRTGRSSARFSWGLG